MEKIRKLLASYKTTLVLLLIYAFLMALATFVEKEMTTEAAKVMIYYSPIFFFLQFLLVVNFILTFIDHRFIKRRRWALIVIHFAFIVILAGALTTHVLGKEGTMHIREGATNNVMVMHTSKGVFTEELPFTLELAEFRLIRYPGSTSPSSYESDLKIHIDGEIREAKIFMNNVLDLKGYRFFQASYDEDEQGTILAVNKDVAGRNVTYAGYFFLIVGFILMFVTPNSRLNKLSRQLKELRKTAVLAAFLLMISFGANAQEFTNHAVFQAVQRNAVPMEHAEEFGQLPVQFAGRTIPMNTFSSELLRKLHKSNKIGKLNSDQFLLGVLTLPQMWMQVPFISNSNNEVARMFQLPEKYIAYAQVFDASGNYKLIDKVNEAHHKPESERNEFDKGILKLDEKINILFLLLNSKLIALFPNADDPNHTWYASGDDLSDFSQEDSLFIARSLPLYLSEVSRSLESGDWQQPNTIIDSIADFQRKADVAGHINPKKIRMEISYNKQNIFGKVRAGYFLLGGLLLILAFFRLFREARWTNVLSGIFVAGIFLVFLYHMYGMGLRWYISGYAPWSNSYETMVYIAWATILAGLIFGRKSDLTLATATIFGGIILFVSGLNWMEPQITTLVPVLKSPWLMIHVAVTVAAYGFFGISLLLGLCNLIIMSITKKEFALLRIKELTIINNMSLLVGLALMTIGTFLGGVWANESWGRYWSWDPKETWALITVVIYAVVTHVHLVKKLNNYWFFNLSSVVAFGSVIMTYLGVNYLLSGLHSYGQNEGVSAMFTYFYGFFALVLVLGIVSYRGFKKAKGSGR
ncbi:MAG: cytochrome c biogenesis protein CcsA [Bacteroidia bacterium]|nr:cytochrome c biogenesis protein CcsA [Bacteroidia bacterium]